MSLEMLEYSKALIEASPDETRIPITTDHNDNITALALLITEVIELHGKIKAVPAIKVACETLFALGYQAGLKADQLDPTIWKLD